MASMISAWRAWSPRVLRTPSAQPIVPDAITEITQRIVVPNSQSSRCC